VGRCFDVHHAEHCRRGGVRQAPWQGTIPGISANNATGKIVIHLTAAYGPFDNVLAFPVACIVDPKGTSISKAQPTAPPAGVGPYKGHEHRAQRVV